MPRRPDDGIRENSARARARPTHAVIIAARTVVLFRGAIKSSVYRGSRAVECRKTRRRSELSALQRSRTDALPVTPGDTAAPRLCIQILRRDESSIKSNLARSNVLSNLQHRSRGVARRSARRGTDVVPRNKNENETALRRRSTQPFLRSFRSGGRVRTCRFRFPVLAKRKEKESCQFSCVTCISHPPTFSRRRKMFFYRC